MSNPTEDREPYPRYICVSGRELEQGDILFNCPILQPLDEELPLLLQKQEVEEKDFKIKKRRYDFIVMTQSCDLERRDDGSYGVDSVLLCPHWNLQESGMPKSNWGNINSGKMARYHLLGRSELSEVSMEIRLIDLNQLISLPLSYVHKLAEEHHQNRLRLGSPYKEHLSQAYARFFMRVGLPQNIKLPK